MTAYDVLVNLFNCHKSVLAEVWTDSIVDQWLQMLEANKTDFVDCAITTHCGAAMVDAMNRAFGLAITFESHDHIHRDIFNAALLHCSIILYD